MYILATYARGPWGALALDRLIRRTRKNNLKLNKFNYNIFSVLQVLLIIIVTDVSSMKTIFKQ